MQDIIDIIIKTTSNTYSEGQGSIRVNDALHGFIFFDQLVWDFIDTPHFQRLRKIKQLACLEYVYPCATHTRFEHSIGTAHLARKFLSLLIKNCPNSYPKDEIQSAYKTITIAALLRNVGHGPYSDSFDDLIGEVAQGGQKKSEKWSYEKASELMFDHMIKQVKQKGKERLRQEWLKHNKKDHNEKQPEDNRLSLDEVRRIKALMKGVSDGRRIWEFEIINNKNNGIDVEKLDYFRRDAFYLSAKNIHIEHELLMNEARIIRDEICYPSEHVEAIYNIFHSRYKLYKNYYFNVVSKTIERMITDALKLTESYFKLRLACEQLYTNSERFLRITDSLTDRIEWVLKRMDKGQERDRFEKAAEIIRRIRTRRIYKFVREIIYYVRERQDAEVLEWYEQQLSEEAVVRNVQQKAHINPSDIFVTINDVGFGLEDANPMKKVGFFRKEKKDKQGELQRLEENETENLSMLYTNAYIERSIKLFLKRDQPSIFEVVDATFLQFCSEFNDKCKKKFSQDTDYVINGKGGNTPLKIVECNENVQPAEEPEFY